MPANLTPAYKTAEIAYRKAREPGEQLEALRGMLRAIPKHKGTEHLQGDIKKKIKQLTDELTGPKKKGSRGGPPTVIPPEGGGQVALVGPPNSGKSSLHAALTHSHAQVGPYPFTTLYPQPGMLPVDDVAVQLVDLPPLSPEHPVPWIANALQPADGCLLVVDLGKAGCMEDVISAHEILGDRKVVLTADWDDPQTAADDPFTKMLPTLIVATHSDEIADVAGELAVFRELTGYDYPALTVSATTGEGLELIGPWLFDRLGIVRVYTKVPGQHADYDRPFTLRRGQTVHDVAMLVHREIAASLKYARLWGGGDFDGQQVGPDHEVDDCDVLELHA